MRAAFRFLLVLLAFCLAAPEGLGAVPALLPGAEPAAEAPGETQAIAQDRSAGEDQRIERRIEGIFAELPAFAAVDAQVEDGVVTLRGLVPAEEDIARAENIVGRIQGVVTIENALARDTSVRSGIGALEQLSTRVQGWLQRLPLIGVALLVALLVTALAYLLAGRERLWGRVMPNPFLAEIAASAIRLFGAIAGIVIALEMLGATTLLGAVLGGAGVIGIALGFAMRDTIENYVASLMLSLRQPFRANDHVLIDGREGHVVRLTSRATILMTLEGNHLRIPNAQVFKAVILNYTRNPQRRFDFELGIDADDDPRAAIDLILRTLGDLPYVLATPEPLAAISQVGDSNIVIGVMAWIDQRDTHWLKARSQTIARVKQALEGGGFVLPEPIYRLRLDPRSEPLPVGRAAEPAKDPASRKDGGASKAMPAGAAPADVQPDTHVDEMVARERQEPHDRSADLLDARRPVE